PFCCLGLVAAGTTATRTTTPRIAISAAGVGARPPTAPRTIRLGDARRDFAVADRRILQRLQHRISDVVRHFYEAEAIINLNRSDGSTGNISFIGNCANK